MSQANAAARKRRAGGATLQDNGVPAQTNNISQQQSPKGGLTLPQVISLVDKRLITLETFMKETQSGGSQTNVSASAAATSTSEDAVNAMADEFDTKFAVLAQEFADLKDVVLKLQAYTMEVNKTLYEERIQVLSDMGQPKDDRIDFHISDDEVGEP
jgi:hypothetical protein